MATSEHFSDYELSCQHGRCKYCHGTNGTTAELVGALEALRAIVGRPVYVDDAYRCPQHNQELANAAQHSQHTLGTAADVRVQGMTAVELYQAAVKVPAIRGIGRNDFANYLHVDVRESPARWCYTKTGATAPWIEPAEVVA